MEWLGAFFCWLAFWQERVTNIPNLCLPNSVFLATQNFQGSDSLGVYRLYFAGQFPSADISTHTHHCVEDIAIVISLLNYLG